MSDLNASARGFDASVDRLVAIKPLLHGERTIKAGEQIPVEDFNADRIGQLIRIRFAKVIPGSREFVAAAVKPKRVEAAVEATGFPCAFPGCDKPGPYKTKLALASHGKRHKRD